MQQLASCSHLIHVNNNNNTLTPDHSLVHCAVTQPQSCSPGLPLQAYAESSHCFCSWQQCILLNATGSETSTGLLLTLQERNILDLMLFQQCWLHLNSLFFKLTSDSIAEQFYPPDEERGCKEYKLLYVNH